MSPARHTTHNPRHGLGSRLGWREISTGGTTPMPDSARAESGARADWRACTTNAFPTRSSYQLYSFSGIRRFCHDNHGSFVFDSPNLFCGPSGSVRTGLTGVRSEPGHRTHLTSLLLVTNGFCSPNDTPKPRKNCENSGRSTPLTGMKSCMVERGCTPKDATKLAVFLRFFRDFPLTFQQSEKFLDRGTVTRPPCRIYACVNWSVVRDRCTRVQGHPRNLFRRPWIFGLSSQKQHT